MGKLIYGTGRQVYAFDDRTLAHVKIAMVTKLRRHEAFLINWTVPAEEGSGRISLWISREIPLAFEFTDRTPPVLNQKWMEALLQTSQRTGGMDILAEADAEPLPLPHTRD